MGYEEYKSYTDTVILPGSGDPITLWHSRLTEQTLEIFPNAKKIIFALWHNIDKQGMFTAEEKIDMIKHALYDIMQAYPQVQIENYQGLLARYAYKNNAIIARGIRDQKDREYEEALDNFWKSQRSWYKTVFIDADPAYKWISSSLAKGGQKDYGNISNMVTPYVKQRLEAKMSDQYIIGLTWVIAAWKNTISNKWLELAKEHNIPMHSLDWDDVAKEMYVDTCDAAVNGRKQIIEMFGEEVHDTTSALPYAVDQQKLWSVFFAADAKEKREHVSQIFRDRITDKWSDYLRGKKWIIVANAALLADKDFLHVVNNNAALVGVDPEEQLERLKKRNWYDDVTAKARIASQATYESKKIKIEDAIKKDRNGSLWEIDNSWSDVGDMKAEKAFNEMISDIDIYGHLRMASLCSRIPDEKVRAETDPKKLLNEIKALYDANGLPYHNWSHIMQVWNDFWKVKHIVTEDAAEKIQWAILFHDIVYQTKWTRRATRRNEEESAILASKFLTKLWYDAKYIFDVMEYITDTKHRDVPRKLDGKILNDLDMKILSEEEEKYDTYKNKIRNEWNHYNDKDFNTWRRSFLTSMSQRKIFHVLTQYEDQAQANIKRELENLQ